jgi:hypothetical protein
MKTQAWRPAAVSTSDAKKEGLYLDELVHFYETETRATSEVPAAAAFIMAIEFVSRGFPFEIREVETQEVVLSSNGRRLDGSHGMMQAMTDSAVMLDGIVKRHLRDFAEQVQTSIREGMQEARAKALALAAPAPKAEGEVHTTAGTPEQAVDSDVKGAESRVEAVSVNQETPGAA